MADIEQSPTRGQMSRLLGMVLILGLAGIALPFLFGGLDRWEYRIESPDDLKITLELDRLGGEGWEVVAARRATSGSGYSSSAAYELILKRKIGLLAALGTGATADRHEALIESIMRSPSPAAPPDVPTRTDYALLDRQGTTLFALLDKRWAGDTSRIRQFGANLCDALKTCTVRFWTSKPTTAFSLPLSSDLIQSQVAVYARPGGQVLLPSR